MKVSNFLLRFIVFIVGVPLLFLAVLAVPHPNYPLFLIIVLAAAGLSGQESAGLFLYPEDDYPGKRIIAAALGLVIPAGTTLVVFELLPEHGIFGLLLVSFALINAGQVFRKGSESIRRIIPSISGHTMTLLYPGIFLGYAVRLTTFPDAGALIVVFLAAVFFNDTMAYVTGRLFGGRSQGVVSISPNKSLAGFVGGLASSPLAILIAEVVRPGLFPRHFGLQIVFGLLVGLAVILGDLVESGIKRSAGVKDSGTLIPGRGGLLDSIDSPVFVAPFFYYLYMVFFL